LLKIEWGGLYFWRGNAKNKRGWAGNDECSQSENQFDLSWAPPWLNYFLGQQVGHYSVFYHHFLYLTSTLVLLSLFHLTRFIFTLKCFLWCALCQEKNWFVGQKGCERIDAFRLPNFLFVILEEILIHSERGHGGVKLLVMGRKVNMGFKLMRQWTWDWNFEVESSLSGIERLLDKFTLWHCTISTKYIEFFGWLFLKTISGRLCLKLIRWLDYFWLNWVNDNC
jgi:hypothetical protein